MYRLAFVLIFAALPMLGNASECSVSGVAYDTSGKPVRAVVRLLDMDSGQAAFAATDSNAAYTIDGNGSGHYRVELISAPAQVTGSHIPTRSILGQSAAFSCPAGERARQDVHAEVD